MTQLQYHVAHWIQLFESDKDLFHQWKPFHGFRPICSIICAPQFANPISPAFADPQNPPTLHPPHYYECGCHPTTKGQQHWANLHSDSVKHLAMFATATKKSRPQRQRQTEAFSQKARQGQINCGSNIITNERRCNNTNSRYVANKGSPLIFLRRRENWGNRSLCPVTIA